MIKKVVLAYSGGLDTSIMIKWIKDKYACEIIAYCADVGQAPHRMVSGQAEELDNLKEKALKSGASKVVIVDLKKEFAENYLFPMLKAGAVYEGKYLLGTAIARPLIAKAQVETAKKEGADAVSHGATGKGNDQVRFELTYKALAPDLKVIAPWREWDLKSREDEIEYAAQHGIHVPVSKEKPYSSDRNLWHISYEGGILEDPWEEAPENIFLLTKSPRKAPDQETFVEIEFEKGIPKKIDGKDFGAVELLQKLNQLGGENGVGRVDMVENRLVGMKSRGVYETPGGTMLYTALSALESITLDRESQHYKQLIAEKYAALVYNGQWFTPIREAFDAFINKLMENVSGTVKLKLYKGNCTAAGRKSPNSLYSFDLATFGEEDIFDQKDAAGFINLFGLPMKVWGMRKKG